MNPDAYLLKLLLFLIFLGLPFRIEAQEHLADSNLKRELVKADAFLITKNLDSALILSEAVLEELKLNGQMDSPLGLEAQLIKGTGLEFKYNDTTALKILLHVKDLSKNKTLWSIYTKSCITLARLYEKIKRVNNSIQHLRLANETIQKYHLYDIYPAFAVRISSWHRMFGDQDSSLFYAKEVLRTASRQEKLFELAEGNLLLGLIHRNDSITESLKYFIASGNLFKQNNNYNDLRNIYLNISSIHFENNNLKAALTYNDSAIAIEKKVYQNNQHRILGDFFTYKRRAQIYSSMGMLDSAIIYMSKGYERQLDHHRDLERAKLLEIEARYTDEKKAQQITEQALLIKRTKDRRNALAALALIILLFAAILAFYSLRLRRANRKTHLQAEQLKNIDIAKSHFFANVSHELRTPLTLVLGPIQSLLKENQLTEKQVKLLQLANRNGKQLEQLVAEILDLQKLETGNMELNEEPTILVAFFQRYCVQFNSLAERKQIKFKIELAIDDDMVANIDQKKCRQILYNLLSNAFKFTPAGGRIKVSILEYEGMLQLKVADTGPGIHPDDLPLVFDRYYQSSKQGQTAEGGTGIGLALCQEYTRLFGGKVEVDSTLGKGSVFRIVFPIGISKNRATEIPSAPLKIEKEDSPTMAQHDAEHLAHAREEVSQKDKSTILVVEDNPELQDYIRIILSNTYQVQTVDHGQAALDLLTSNDHEIVVDLILSDLMMPVMDGYQLLQHLKNNDTTRQIPVIMLTARAEAKDKLKALRIGVDDYLTKPFEDDELIVRIENLLRNQNIRRTELLASDEHSDAADDYIPSNDQEWLEAFELFVRQHIGTPNLTIPKLAHQFAMSESTLLRQLKRSTGLSTKKYLREIRLDEARRLLEQKVELTIAELANKVGYKDARTFSRSFRRRFGKLPSDYIND